MFEIGGSRYEMSVVFDAMKADKMIANKSAAGYATRPMPNERLDRIRDVFCFCALTGLAFTDVDHLRREHFTTDEEGQLWIYKPREKTAVMSRVPVLPQAAALLEKYRDDANCRARGKLLPVPSNTKMNAYLKEIADICQIHKHLTTHLARHSFASLITLDEGVPIETISRMLGHSNIQTTQIYARVTPRKLFEDMDRLIAATSDLKLIL